MAIKSDTQNKLARALGDQPAAAEYTDAIDALTTLLDVTAGTAEASKALVLDANGAISTITTLDVTTAKIGGTAITATAAELNRVDGAADGDGELAGPSGISIAESGTGIVHKTVLTFSAWGTAIHDGTAGHSSRAIYDFPAGRILILGVTADLSYDVSGGSISNTGSGDFSLGTTGTADLTLDGTDVNLLPSTGMADPFVAGVGAATGALAASAHFDGTTSAVTVHLSSIFDAGDVSEHTPFDIDGTVTIHWINLGDY